MEIDRLIHLNGAPWNPDSVRLAKLAALKEQFVAREPQGGGDHRVAEDLPHCSKPRLLVTMIEPRS